MAKGGKKIVRSRPLPPPPDDVEGWANIVRPMIVKLFDRQDGEGANWKFIAEVLFKVAFGVLDRLPDDDKRAMARRVHAGAYERVAGNGAGQGIEPKAPPVLPSHAVAFFTAAKPRPPR